jgi:hypothetical protein
MPPAPRLTVGVCDLCWGGRYTKAVDAIKKCQSEHSGEVGASPEPPTRRGGEVSP